MAVWRGPSFARGPARPAPKGLKALGEGLWYAVVAIPTAYLLWLAIHTISRSLGWGDLEIAFGLGALTMLRVAVLVGLATLVWLPLGILIGLNPRLARTAQPMAPRLRCSMASAT